MNIPLRVKNLVARHDTSDPLNCLVYFVSLPPTVNVFWKCLLNRRIIALNKNLPEWKQAAVLCHELGHIICHGRYTAFSMRNASYSNTRIEREADEFATYLMAYRYNLDEYYVSQFLSEGWRA